MKYKKILKLFVSFIILLVVVIGSYGGYILLSYNRIGNQNLEVNNVNDNLVEVNKTYKALSYNIGFGAYSQDFTFFLDSGYDENGKETVGHYSKAKSKDEVLFNINGVINTLKDEDADFVLLQEVDVKSTRSYKINQYQKIKEALNDYNNVFAQNMHTAYLPYPLYDMHGKTNAGLTSLAKYTIDKAMRREYTISSSLSKLFDLDRCFLVTTFKTSNNKTLYVINNHMSAYDEGGVIRQKQMLELNDYVEEKVKNGDYVIVGGDFNHDLLTFNPMYNYDENNKPFSEKKKNPEWLKPFFNENKKVNDDLFKDFTIYASNNAPSCRNNDIEWEIGKTFTCSVDGFLVSNNIEVNLVKTIVSQNGNKNLDGFAFSDHEAVTLSFKLK